MAALVFIGLGVAGGALLWQRPYALMRLAHGSARLWFGVEARSIEVGGHRWPYLEGGRADAPPVILLHGYGTSKEAMMTMMSWLSGSHRVIAPDLPGFGQHEAHGLEAHDGAFYAREVLRFMDAVGVERTSLLGTSMGGAIAAEIAIAAPSRIDRLVLLAPAGLRAPRKNDFMIAADRGENPLQLETPADFDRIVDLVFYKPPPTPEPARRYFVLEAQRRLPGTKRIIESMRDYVLKGLEGRLGAIQAPTLVLWGTFDLVLDPSLLFRFANEIPGARVNLIADAGHVLFHDAPESVRAEIVPFLDPTKAPPGPNAPTNAPPAGLEPPESDAPSAARTMPPPASPN